MLLLRLKLLALFLFFGFQQNVYSSSAGGGATSFQPRDALEAYELSKRDRFSKNLRKGALAEGRAKDRISLEDYEHLKGASAAQASLAQELHQKGIRGKGVTIWLLENSGINEHKKVSRYVTPDSNKLPVFEFTEAEDHGTNMASLSHQIAPESTLGVYHVKDYLVHLQKKTEVGEAPDIINASFGSEKTLQEVFSGIFELSPDFLPLLVKAAGNSGENLSKIVKFTDTDRILRSHLLFAGNLRQDGRPRKSSAAPGENPEIQARFLWVKSDDMLADGGPRGGDGVNYITGTSGAAAILSGAAALIKGHFPTFTMAEISEILLESADQDFFQYFGDGYHAVHVVSEASPEKAAAPGLAAAGGGGGAPAGRVHVKEAVFDPAIYGKGVLNLRNALIYADFKSKTMSKASPAEIREAMLGVIKEKENQSKGKIREWLMTRLEGEEGHRRLPKLNKPLPLVPDAKLAGRKYAKAKGTHKGAVIPEPDPREAGKLEGFVYDGPEESVDPAKLREQRIQEKWKALPLFERLKQDPSKAVYEAIEKADSMTFEAFVQWFNDNPEAFAANSKWKIYWKGWSGPEEAERNLLGHILEQSNTPKKDGKGGEFDYRSTIAVEEKILNGLLVDYTPIQLPLLNQLMKEKKPGTFGAWVGLLERLVTLPESIVSKENQLDYLRGAVSQGSSPEIARIYMSIEDLDPRETIRRDYGPATPFIHIAVEAGVPLDELLSHYEERGYGRADLLNLKSTGGENRGSTVSTFGLHLDKIYTTEDLKKVVDKYIAQGAVFSSDILQSWTLNHVLLPFPAYESHKDEGNYVSEASIRENFMKLKRNAFILDYPGFSYEVSSDQLGLYPIPVTRYLEGKKASSSEEWTKVADEAWSIFEAFLRENGDSTAKMYHYDRTTGRGGDIFRPVRLILDGKTYYYRQFNDWKAPESAGGGAGGGGAS